MIYALIIASTIAIILYTIHIEHLKAKHAKELHNKDCIIMHKDKALNQIANQLDDARDENERIFSANIYYLDELMELRLQAAEAKLEEACDEL